MIVVREVFHLRPESMKEAKGLVRTMKAVNARLGAPLGRVMTDLTGPYYTLVIETDFPSLAEFEGGLARVFADSQWQEAYAGFRPTIVSGQREIYTLVE
ncbi:MAG TPA: NIPSNAP family protein [Holophagaceae bacterium]|nr:NIPSNAP family protein [Holophagaceae bacterium]